MADAAVDFAAVGFKLSFARSASSDSAAQLRHLRASSGQPGKHVLQLRQFDLKLAFAGSRVAGEDVEDQLRAVDDAHIEFALQVALLRGREFVVEDRQLGASRRQRAFQLLDFAAADKRGRIGARPALQHLAGDDRSGALRKARAAQPSNLRLRSW